MFLANIFDSLDTVLGIAFGFVALFGGLYIIRAQRRGKLTRVQKRIALFLGIVLVLLFAVVLAVRLMRH